MDLISTIIVFGFLEIQSNNVPVDDKLTKVYSKSNYQVTKLPRCILNQVNRTYTCTCLGYEFCFHQHVTRQLHFSKPLSTNLRLNKNPGCLVFFYNRLLFFFGNSVNVHFQWWFTVFPIHIISNGNRTEWSPIRSVIIRVINKIGRPLSGSLICLITKFCYQLIIALTKFVI